MRRRYHLAVGMILAAVLCMGIGMTAAGSDTSSPLAFNGTNLAGWKVPEPNPYWRAENGVLIGENDPLEKGSMLYTQHAYSNFIFQAEVRWSGEIDSGVMFRKPELQLQFGVSRSLKTDMTGAYYTGGQDKYPDAGRPKDLGKVFKPGEWNLFRLEANGDKFTTWVNGEKVSEYRNPKFKEPGPIGLQIHPGLSMKVEFRNIRIRSLDP